MLFLECERDSKGRKKKKKRLRVVQQWRAGTRSGVLARAAQPSAVGRKETGREGPRDVGTSFLPLGPSKKNTERERKIFPLAPSAIEKQKKKKARQGWIVTVKFRARNGNTQVAGNLKNFEWLCQDLDRKKRKEKQGDVPNPRGMAPNSDNGLSSRKDQKKKTCFQKLASQ